jgi:hypothetical protein
MRKVVVTACFVVLSLAFTVIFPQLSASRPFVDGTFCTKCHRVSDLQSNTGHGGDCNLCHTEPPPAATVFTDTCIQCHPVGDPGRCELIRFHDALPDEEKTVTVNGLFCIECHVNCEEGAPQPPGEGGITLQQTQIFRSSLLALPQLITIEGTDTNVTRRTIVKLTPSASGSIGVIPLLKLNFNQVIQQWVIVMPSILPGVSSENETLEVEVDGLTASLDILLLGNQ